MTQAARKKAKEHGRQQPDEDIVRRADLAAMQLGSSASVQNEQTEDKILLESALSALDQASREVIVLYYYEEMSVKEVAQTLGILEGTVKSRLYFARKKLKRIVQEGGYREK